MSKENGFIIPTIIGFILISSCWLLVINLELLNDIVATKALETNIQEQSAIEAISYYITNFDYNTQTCQFESLEIAGSVINLKIKSNCVVESKSFDINKIDERKTNVNDVQFDKLNDFLSDVICDFQKEEMTINNELVDSNFKNTRLIITATYNEENLILDIDMSQKKIINIIPVGKE